MGIWCAAYEDGSIFTQLVTSVQLPRHDRGGDVGSYIDAVGFVCLKVGIHIVSSAAMSYLALVQLPQCFRRCPDVQCA